MTRDSDDDVLILSPAKKVKMEISKRANATPFIKIEQLVKHDVWDIRKKNDGAFVMKKLNENHDAGASTNNTGLNVNVGSTMNPEQSGVRPKVTVQVSKNNTFTINAVNPPKNVAGVPRNHNVVTAKVVNVPVGEVHVPKTNRVITVNPMNAPKSGFTAVSTLAAPPREVIAINPRPMPKENVITFKMPTSSKKNVITMKTATGPNMDVITINTAKKSPLQNEAALSRGSMKLEPQAKYLQNTQINQGFAMSLDPTSHKSSSSSGYAPSESTPVYTDEACRIQEMFPEIPLNAIVYDLMITKSVDDTIENMLKLPVPAVSHNSCGGLFGPSSSTTSVVSQNSQSGLHSPSSTALPSGSSVVHHSDMEVVPPRSTKMGNVSGTKKGGSVIKIELLEQNEVWDIKRKDKQGYVMKKVIPDTDSQSQSNKPDNSSCADNLTEPMEEESDELLSADIFVDDMPYKANPAEVAAPVKLMMLSSKCSSKNSTDSKTRGIAVPGEEKMDTSIQVHSLNDDGIGDGVSSESFAFSDDENEEGETIEHFLFKASLVLKKRGYLREAENENGGDSALLNITGGVRNEEENESTMAEEGCASDEDDEYYTDECYTDEES